MADVHEPNCLSAWQEGVKLIRANHGELFNLVTTIEDPSAFNQQWLKTYSPSSVVLEADRLSDVVHTVFPMKLRARYVARPDFYAEYTRINQRAMKWPRNRTRWGTYFQRLIAYDNRENQLETAIQKLKTWQRYTTALVFHLSCPLVDKPRIMGGPCWHFGEIVWKKGDVLDLVAVYRNHDFFNKAFGNFVALGQLLHFIATEANKTPGKLICHSVHAYTEGSLQTLSKLAQV